LNFANRARAIESYGLSGELAIKEEEAVHAVRNSIHFVEYKSAATEGRSHSWQEKEANQSAGDDHGNGSLTCGTEHPMQQPRESKRKQLDFHRTIWNVNTVNGISLDIAGLTPGVPIEKLHFHFGRTKILCAYSIFLTRLIHLFAMQCYCR
jgi:hypothetical protein